MKYKVRIEEILARTVVIEAEDEIEAYEITKGLYNEGVINLNCEDFIVRNTEVQGEATKHECELFYDEKITAKTA